SNEDSKKVVNAGGNESKEYISPDFNALTTATGEVIASYFSEISLKIQLESEGDPFNEPLQLSVLFNELIGESPDQGNDQEIPVSVVMFTTEPHYSDQEFRLRTISSTFGHGTAVVDSKGINTDT